MAKETKKQEVAVINKLEELKDYATQTENYYLLGRINRIIEEVKTDEIAQEQIKGLEPLKEEHIFEYKSNTDEDLKIVSEILENYHEEDVHEVATAKIDLSKIEITGIKNHNVFSKDTTFDIKKEVTWESIQDNFETEEYKSPEYGITEQHSEMKALIFNWLSNNYNVPTKKQ